MLRTTDEPLVTMEEYVASTTLARMRRAQAIVQAQIPMAFKDQNTQALEALTFWENWYAEAIYLKAFGDAEL